MAKIFFISGFGDVQSRGNQTMKNTVKYLSEFGHKIDVFTFLPGDYPNLLNPDSVFNSNVKYRRLPGFLMPLVHFGWKIKDTLGRWRLPQKKTKNLELEKPVDYYGEYNFFGRFSYVIFLFLLYFPIEFFRTLFFYFKEKPDIFYGFNCQGVLVASFLGRIFNKPIVARHQGAGIERENLKSFMYRLSLADDITGIKAYCDALIMNDDRGGIKEILDELKVDLKKVNIWMNGLDTDNLAIPDGWDAQTFKRQKGLAGKKIILMVSRLAFWKRVDRGIFCAAQLVKKYHVTDFKLLIAGEGPELPRLKEMARSYGIGDRVEFLGGIPHNEVCKYYSIADVFLTLYDISNLGNPLLEAMYFSLPAVTINDGSTANLLVDGKNSFLFSIENIKKELPQKMARLLKDENLRKQIGKNAKETFQRKVLSWKERIKLEDEIIQKLLHKNHV